MKNIAASELNNPQIGVKQSSLVAIMLQTGIMCNGMLNICLQEMGA